MERTKIPENVTPSFFEEGDLILIDGESAEVVDVVEKGMDGADRIYFEHIDFDSCLPDASEECKGHDASDALLQMKRRDGHLEMLDPA